MHFSINRSFTGAMCVIFRGIRHFFEYKVIQWGLSRSFSEEQVNFSIIMPFNGDYVSTLRFLGHSNGIMLVILDGIGKFLDY